jgi:hypothetical protein
MPIPAFNPTKNVGVPEPEFGTEKFVYDEAKDVYVCPGRRNWAFGKAISRVSLSWVAL